jgi:GDP-4-dehydro-6-deoxy-D-mannose reductase
MKKALITGAAGFVGSHLSGHLVTNGIEVYGLIHPEHSSQHTKSLEKKIKIIKCDILKRKDLENILKNQDFEYVFHLAAFSSPPQSFLNPKETLENNIIGELNLLEILVKIGSSAQVLIVGSADEYGTAPKRYLPIDEDTPLAPQSPYAVSKIAQDMLGLQFYLRHKLNLIRVRPFNHIGPGQSKTFVVPAFASQIAKLEKAGGGEILVGNLNSWRDFTDVRDMVRAYLLALEKADPGDVYNIGSGKAYKIADILKELISFSKVEIKVKQDPKLIRDMDIEKISCDFSKFKKQTGWYPQIPITRTLFDTIEYERHMVK